MCVDGVRPGFTRLCAFSYIRVCATVEGVRVKSLYNNLFSQTLLRYKSSRLTWEQPKRSIAPGPLFPPPTNIGASRSTPLCVKAPLAKQNKTNNEVGLYILNSSSGERLCPTSGRRPVEKDPSHLHSAAARKPLSESRRLTPHVYAATSICIIGVSSRILGVYQFNPIAVLPGALQERGSADAHAHEVVRKARCMFLLIQICYLSMSSGIHVFAKVSHSCDKMEWQPRETHPGSLDFLVKHECQLGKPPYKCTR